jgi:hypothetical protein
MGTFSARAKSSSVRGLGFEVTALEDVGLRQMRAAVAKFGQHNNSQDNLTRRRCSTSQGMGFSPAVAII